jgi:ABC-type multidrug transport system fused ATPase/permease subunit
MNPTVLAVRAITTTYAQTILKPLLFIGIGIYVAVLLLIGWIAYAASPWWWLLAVVPTVIFFVALLLWTLAFLLSKRLAPRMDREQKKTARRFVGRTGKAAEHLGTPRFVLVFRVIRDLLFPPVNGQTFLGEVSGLPGELRRDFDDLRRSFGG